MLKSQTLIRPTSPNLKKALRFSIILIPNLYTQGGTIFCGIFFALFKQTSFRAQKGAQWIIKTLDSH